MSSHVVVIDPTARKVVIKTTPSSPLTNILHDACARLGVDASQYSLKHQSRQLDLSLSFRLSGLSPGAKLELVQQSRSPSIVTVALQLPESEARGAPNSRLLDKFPSTTTLWQILRQFEAGVAGNQHKRNLTARGMPVTSSGSSEAGRLYYQVPVIHVMGRELSSFTDLQKSLMQLGFNSGSILLRLSFRTTQEPLEEAMLKISNHFSGSEDNTSANVEAAVPVESTDDQTEAASQPAPSTLEPPNPVSSTPVESSPRPDSSQIPSTEPALATSVSGRPITVFRPPSSLIPQSALAAYNEKDYVLSIEQAKSHKERLNLASRPSRLLSDAEIAAKAAAEKEKLAMITEVEVKFRFPEQSQVVAKFGRLDTGAILYSFARRCLNEGIVNEPFSLTFASGPGGVGRGHIKSQTVIPDSDQTFLVENLGIKGRLLVNFTWDDKASMTARGSGSSLLKRELRRQAQELKVPSIPDATNEAEANSGKSTLGKLGAALRGNNEADSKSSGRKGGMPKWFKMPGNK